MYQSIGYAAATARNNAGFNQEPASEALHISPRTLSAYENDRMPIPDETIFNMIKVYNAPWLGYEYLRMATKTGNLILPEISFDHLSANVCGLQVEMRHVDDMRYELSEICRDNIVSKDEEQKWKVCMKEVKELIGALFSLKLAPIQKETASNTLAANR